MNKDKKINKSIVIEDFHNGLLPEVDGYYCEILYKLLNNKFSLHVYETQKEYKDIVSKIVYSKKETIVPLNEEETVQWLRKRNRFIPNMMY